LREKLLDGFLFFTPESSCTITRVMIVPSNHLQRRSAREHNVCRKEAVIVCVSLVEPTSAGTRRAR